jgi:hypothetical protein
MITIEQLFNIFKTMTEEDWNLIYREAEDPNQIDSELVINWNEQYSDSKVESTVAYNLLYKFVESGRLSELSEDVQKLVQEWNY